VALAWLTPSRQPGLLRVSAAQELYRKFVKTAVGLLDAGLPREMLADEAWERLLPRTGGDL